jgi:hypothetical protein
VLLLKYFSLVHAKGMSFLVVLCFVLPRALASVCDPKLFPEVLSVVVTNPSSSNLTDYPVAIALDEMNFDFSLSKSDGSDIAVWNSRDGKILWHWLESYDASSSRGWSG